MMDFSLKRYATASHERFDVESDVGDEVVSDGEIKKIITADEKMKHFSSKNGSYLSSD